MDKWLSQSSSVQNKQKVSSLLEERNTPVPSMSSSKEQNSPCDAISSTNLHTIKKA